MHPSFSISITADHNLVLSMQLTPQATLHEVVLLSQLEEVVSNMPEDMWEKLQEARNAGKPTIRVATPQHLKSLEKLKA